MAVGDGYMPLFLDYEATKNDYQALLLWVGFIECSAKINVDEHAGGIDKTYVCAAMRVLDSFFPQYGADIVSWSKSSVGVISGAVEDIDRSDKKYFP